MLCGLMREPAYSNRRILASGTAKFDIVQIRGSSEFKTFHSYRKSFIKPPGGGGLFISSPFEGGGGLNRDEGLI